MGGGGGGGGGEGGGGGGGGGVWGPWANPRGAEGMPQNRPRRIARRLWWKAFWLHCELLWLTSAQIVLRARVSWLLGKTP